MSRVLVIEKTDHLQSLFSPRFAGELISVAVSLLEAAVEEFHGRGYDVLIWDAVAPKTAQANGLK